VRRQYIGRGERKVDPSLLAAEAGGTVVVGGGWRELGIQILGLIRETGGEGHACLVLEFCLYRDFFVCGGGNRGSDRS